MPKTVAVLVNGQLRQSTFQEMIDSALAQHGIMPRGHEAHEATCANYEKEFEKARTGEEVEQAVEDCATEVVLEEAVRFQNNKAASVHIVARNMFLEAVDEHLKIAKQHVLADREKAVALPALHSALSQGSITVQLYKFTVQTALADVMATRRTPAASNTGASRGRGGPSNTRGRGGSSRGRGQAAR